MHSRLFEDAKTANLARYAEVHALIHSSALTALTRRSRFACALPIRCFCLSVISEGGGWMPRLAQPVTPGGHHSRGRPPPPP